jgi:transcriptional regulator with XRE-family HTH domain
VKLVLTKTDIIILRHAFGFSRRQLAFLLDVSYGYIANIEKGRKPISKTLEQRIIERLHLTPERLERIKILSKRLEELEREGRINTDKLKD